MKGTSPSRGCGEAAAFGIESAMMEFLDFINTSGGEIMNIIVIGIDLAKNIFAATTTHHRIFSIFPHRPVLRAVRSAPAPV